MIFEKLCAIIAEQFSVEEDTIDTTTAFEDDLHADSLDLVELMMSLEEEFELDELDEGVIDNVKTVGDAVNMIKKLTGE